MILKALYNNGADSFSHEVFDRSSFSLAFSSVDFEQLRTISLTSDSTNSLGIQIGGSKEGIATLILNGKPLYQKDILKSKTDIYEALERYLNGKYGYKVFYSFSSTPVHSAQTNQKYSNPEQTQANSSESSFQPKTNVLDSIDFDRSVFKPSAETALKKNRQRPTAQRTPKVTKRPFKGKNNIGNLTVLGVIFGFLLILVISQVYNANYIDAEDVRAQGFDTYINSSGSYIDPRGTDKIISITNDGAQHGFVLLKLKNLTNNQTSLVYNSQQLPDYIKAGANIKTEPITLNGGLNLKHPVVYIDF